MLAFTEGGLHIFGGFIFGGLAAFIYARRNQLDWLMILDSIAPSLLISQALARPANFINQELYGPPTDLPWGISIEQGSRIGEWRDMDLFPFETTRFHPTFAYEMVWNLITGGILLWLSRKYPERFKPGAVFAIWMIMAGVGRFIVEAFRPDQPTIGDSTLSYSRLISALMAVVGVIWLLVRTERLSLSFWRPGPDNYFIAKRWIKLAKDKERAKQKEEQLAKRQAAKGAKGGKGTKRKGAK
jgi:phosphatidylglycerol:prolipoprotein diacylglycerol transferase